MVRYFYVTTKNVAGIVNKNKSHYLLHIMYTFKSFYHHNNKQV